MRKILLLCFVLFSAGCSTTHVKMYRDVPAEINVARYDAIAIDSTTGPYSRELSSQLKSNFLNSNYFKLVSPDSAASHNTLLVSADVVDKDFSNKRRRRKGVCYSNGKKYKCMLYSTSATWRANTVFRLTDAKTGEIFKQKNIAKQERKHKTKQDGYVRYSRKNGFAALMRATANDFANALQPHKELVKLKLFEDDKIPSLKPGIEIAKTGHWGKASKYFKDSIEFCRKNNIDPEATSKAYYNYGVALGYGGIDYDMAISNLSKAIELHADSDYSTALSETEKFKMEAAEIERQGYAKK